MDLNTLYREMPKLRERLIWLPETTSTLDAVKE